MNHYLENESYIKEILQLNEKFPDRYVFHDSCRSILQEMGNDTTFLKKVVQRNFKDQGYLDQEWSLYNIPFFYVYEHADFYVKLHFFVPLASHEKGIGASCIHHHNNYILTTAAILGSGYETMLFSKEIDMDMKTLETRLKVTQHFTQKERPVHCIQAWEPHLVFNPESFSATLQLWTPDRKRATDQLKSQPLLKAIKNPLRKIIYFLGLEQQFGIAASKTYQWYPSNDHFIAIEENTYFEPTRRAKGSEIDNYSIQTVFKFIQEKGIVEEEFLSELLRNENLPKYYHSWIHKVLLGEQIQETHAKNALNIPGGTFTREQVAKAANYKL